jgi:TPR repeat protein
MSMKMLVLLLAMSFALAGCGEGLKSPSDAFLIPQEQMTTVVKEANAGDLDAVKRLIAHYEATSGNDALAEEWRAKARSLGDAQELYYYAAKLFTGAKVEADPIKKRDMLVEALKAAERSSSSHADASTQQLVEEITRSLKSM